MPDDDRLRYYAGTAAGLEAAREEAARMATLLETAYAKRLVT